MLREPSGAHNSIDRASSFAAVISACLAAICHKRVCLSATFTFAGRPAPPPMDARLPIVADESQSTTESQTGCETREDGVAGDLGDPPQRVSACYCPFKTNTLLTVIFKLRTILIIGLYKAVRDCVRLYTMLSRGHRHRHQHRHHRTPVCAPEFVELCPEYGPTKTTPKRFKKAKVIFDADNPKINHLRR